MRLFISRLSRVLALVGLIGGASGAALAQQGAAPQAAPPAGQAQETRFGFVIGNDSYDGTELPTAANDASLIADTLKTAGFDVTGARNLDQDTFRASYREFLSKVSAAGPNAVAAIYLSGYGLQFEGENYFVPVGAQINRESDIGINAIRLSDLTRPLAGLQGHGSVVMLDLAHKTPFLQGVQGLAPGLALIEPEANTLISLNAAPGMVAPAATPPYGAYAQSLAEVIRLGGLTANEIFDRVRLRTAQLTRNAQTPWSASRIATPLILLERAADAPQAEVVQDIVEQLDSAAIPQMDEKQAYAAALKRDSIKDYQAYTDAFPNSPHARNVRSLTAARREALTWQRTVAANTPNAYWSYLKRYPRGPHAGDARRRLNRLQAAVEPPPVFDPYEYDVPPPPPEELAYFGDPRGYVGLEPVEVVEVVRPPRWWRPPPPPVFVGDDDYFLPAPPPVGGLPGWIAPPAYVAEPILPYYDRPAASGIPPYVAIPAALAAGIAVGKLISRNKRNAIGTPFKPAVLPPTTLQPGRTHGRTFNTSFGATQRPVTPINRTLPPTQAGTFGGGLSQPTRQTTLPPVVPNPAQLRQVQQQQQRDQAAQLRQQQLLQRQQLLQSQRAAGAQGAVTAAQKAQFERDRAAQLRAQQAQTRQLQVQQQQAAQQQRAQAAQQAAQQRAIQIQQQRTQAQAQRDQQAAQQRVQARQDAERKALLQQQRANAAQMNAAQRAQAQQQRAAQLRAQQDQRARLLQAQQAQRAQAAQAAQQQRAMQLQQAAQQRAAQQRAIQAQQSQAASLAAQRARAAAARAQRGCLPGRPCPR